MKKYIVMSNANEREWADNMFGLIGMYVVDGDFDILRVAADVMGETVAEPEEMELVRNIGEFAISYELREMLNECEMDIMVSDRMKEVCHVVYDPSPNALPAMCVFFEMCDV